MLPDHSQGLGSLAAIQDMPKGRLRGAGKPRALLPASGPYTNIGCDLSFAVS